MRHYRRNADERLRRAERTMLVGGVEDQARLIVENLRSRRLTPDRVILAATTNPAARLVTRGMGLEPSRRLWNRYISGAYSDPAEFMEEVLDPGWGGWFGVDSLGDLLLMISRKVSVKRRMLACIMAACLEPFEKAYTRELRSDDANLLKQALRILNRSCSGRRGVAKRELMVLDDALERQAEDMFDREVTTGDWDRGERLGRVRTILVIVQRYLALHITHKNPYSLLVETVAWSLEVLGSMGIYVRPKARVHERWRDLVVEWCLDPSIQ